MTLAAAQEFRIGDVVGQSFQTTIRNIIPFGILAIIAAVIIAVLYMIISGIFGLSMMPMTPGTMESGAGMAAVGASVFIGFLVFELLALAVYLAFAAAITYGTIQDLRPQGVGFSSLLQNSVNLVVPAISTFIVLIIVFLAAGIVAYILNLIPILGQIATIAMFVFLYVIFWVVIPVAVIERPGPVASLTRSIALTQGSRWKILGIFLIMLAAIIVAFFVAAIFMFISVTLWGIVTVLLYAAFIIFAAVLTAVGYHRLRVAKEGADIGDIARVFD